MKDGTGTNGSPNPVPPRADDDVEARRYGAVMSQAQSFAGVGWTRARMASSGRPLGPIFLRRPQPKGHPSTCLRCARLHRGVGRRHRLRPPPRARSRTRCESPSSRASRPGARWPLGFVDVAGEECGFAEAREGDGEAGVRPSALCEREQLRSSQADVLVPAGSAKAN